MPDPVSGAIIGSAVIGAGASIFGANKAADAQTNAAAQATQAQMQMFREAQAQAKQLFGQGRSDELGMLGTATGIEQPFIDWGKAGMSPLSRLLSPGPDQTAALEETPGYKFALSQGEKGVTNQATMRGLSGNALREGAGFASGLAQNTWQSVVDRLMQQVGVGSSAAGRLSGETTNTGISIGNQSVGLSGQLTNAANVTGNNIGNNITGAGNAQAGAAIASGNAISGAAGNVGNMVALNALTGNKLWGATGGAPGGMYYNAKSENNPYGDPIWNSGYTGA